MSILLHYYLAHYLSSGNFLSSFVLHSTPLYSSSFITRLYSSFLVLLLLLLLFLHSPLLHSSWHSSFFLFFFSSLSSISSSSFIFFSAIIFFFYLISLFIFFFSSLFFCSFIFFSFIIFFSFSRTGRPSKAAVWVLRQRSKPPVRRAYCTGPQLSRERAHRLGAVPFRQVRREVEDAEEIFILLLGCCWWHP